MRPQRRERRTPFGADSGENLIEPVAVRAAAERLRGLNNVRDCNVGPDELESNSFDLVYSTNMLAQLDEMDRCRYVKDASAASSGWTPVQRQY